MKLSIKNLGYIKSGTFDSNDLTVIFGKNNSGKTYLSYAVYIFASEIKQKLHVFASSNIKLDQLLSPENGENSIVLKLQQIMGSDTTSTINQISSYFLADSFNVDYSHFMNSDVKFDFKSLIKKAKNAEFEIVLNSRFVDKNVIVTKTRGKDDIIVTTIQKNEFSQVPTAVSGAVSNFFYRYQILENIINEILDLDVKNPFVITSERTGIEMFYKEMDNNRSEIAERISLRTNVTKDISDDSSVSGNNISRYSKPISDNIKTIRNQLEIRKSNSELSRMDDFHLLSDSLNKNNTREIRYKCDW
ncbi:hypothetical protein [Citrobacter portucalensis]|uniref:hypothetical protein n=1 Tax=Citrobacter portucalensis TaxID=1639133 RepID=UPI003BF522B3